MPLFQSHPYPEPGPPAPVEPAPRHAGGFFSSLSLPRRDHPTPASTEPGNSDYRSATSHPHDNDGASVRSGFFFGRRRSADSLASQSTQSTTKSGHSRSTSASRSTPPTSPASHSSLKSSPSIKSNGGNSLLTSTLKRYTARAHQDPTVVQAREKIAAAAAAEEEADRAILHARARVKDALQSVQVLEGEAEGEAKRARAKNAIARLVSKDARGLGRHGEQ
ncbi:hypothetical protein MVEN_02123100 [Mycena venus]|uniref:Uncharacterized protein n=1 Tax=Mycena venus TaxID=2733690 RepID=A0A8H7CIQ6_9AGAR|nr:hypothetical protein MVEN_02123100 [Mycena venus]